MGIWQWHSAKHLGWAKQQQRQGVVRSSANGSVPATKACWIGAAVLMMVTYILPAPVWAWGEAGHRMIGEVAAQNLPTEMPEFFRNAVPQLAYLNPEPDRWRDGIEIQLDPALNAAKAPEHYVDMEKLNEAMRLAPNRDAYLAAIHAGGEGAVSVGILPFAILDRFQLLRIEFRLWRETKDPQQKRYIEERAINEAGILGHYVADGSNPHHTTIHHNGWVGDNPNHYTTDHSFHFRFEDLYVGSHIHAADLMPLMKSHPVQIFAQPRSAVWGYLESSHSQLDALYQLEQKAPFNDQTTAPEDRAFAQQRLVAGAAMLRDLWVTAWASSEVTTEQREALAKLQAQRAQATSSANSAGSAPRSTPAVKP